jgi:excisionase family DNA binding protein
MKANRKVSGKDDHKVSDKELQRYAHQRAMSIDEFCDGYGLGRTKAYEELKSGRLRGRKIGKRTLITEDDAEDWLRSLPVMGADAA